MPLTTQSPLSHRRKFFTYLRRYLIQYIIQIYATHSEYDDLSRQNQLAWTHAIILLTHRREPSSSLLAQRFTPQLRIQPEPNERMVACERDSELVYELTLIKKKRSLVSVLCSGLYLEKMNELTEKEER